MEPLTMATDLLFLYVRAIGRHFAPNRLGNTPSAITAIGFFKGPRQSLSLNHHSANLPAQLNEPEQGVRRDTKGVT